MPVSALDLIESALGRIQVLAAGETVAAEDAATCLARLNSLVSAWEAEGMFAYTITETVFTLPANTTTMTIGPLQQVDLMRPIKVLLGSFTRINNVDYRLNPATQTEYNLIGLKSAYNALAPSIVYYDGETPTGNLYFWPPVGGDVEVHLMTPEEGGRAEDLYTSYLFPDGYQRAIELALAIDIAPDFSITPSPYLLQQAATAQRAVKRQNQRVPELDMAYPSDTKHSSVYDLLSGG
jgi:hypothetical protein